MQIEKIKLTDTLSIYKAKYDWSYSKSELIDKVKQNYHIVGLSDNTVSIFHIQSKAINHIKQYGRELVMELMGLSHDDVDTWAEQHWIYYSNRTTTQPDSATFYHTHPITITKAADVSIQKIKTDWTYCFYLDVPTDLVGDEGKLMFKDSNDCIGGIRPTSGDFLIFGPNDLHVPNFIPSSSGERIAICANVTFNIDTYKKEYTLL